MHQGLALYGQVQVDRVCHRDSQLALEKKFAGSFLPGILEKKQNAVPDSRGSNDCRRVENLKLSGRLFSGKCILGVLSFYSFLVCKF